MLFRSGGAGARRAFFFSFLLLQGRRGWWWRPRSCRQIQRQMSPVRLFLSVPFRVALFWVPDLNHPRRRRVFDRDGAWSWGGVYWVHVHARVSRMTTPVLSTGRDPPTDASCLGRRAAPPSPPYFAIPSLLPGPRRACECCPSGMVRASMHRVRVTRKEKLIDGRRTGTARHSLYSTHVYIFHMCCTFFLHSRDIFLHI